MDHRYIRSFCYDILTPQGRVGTGQTYSAVLPAVDGAIGVLARRAPLVAALGTGCLTLRLAEGRSADYFVIGGFAHIHQGALTVLPEQCVPAESLDLKTVETELEQARRMPIKSRDDWPGRDRAVTIAAAKVRIARKQVMRTATPSETAHP